MPTKRVCLNCNHKISEHDSTGDVCNKENCRCPGLEIVNANKYYKVKHDPNKYPLGRIKGNNHEEGI